jgi:hypothetical protein
MRVPPKWLKSGYNLAVSEVNYLECKLEQAIQQRSIYREHMEHYEQFGQLQLPLGTTLNESFRDPTTTK